MEFFRYPEWSATIRNCYWYLRYARGFDLAKISKRYRQIAVEKKGLQSESGDSELIRLLCRHMVNLKNHKAPERFWNVLWVSTQNNLPNPSISSTSDFT